MCSQTCFGGVTGDAGKEGGCIINNNWYFFSDSQECSFCVLSTKVQTLIQSLLCQSDAFLRIYRNCKCIPLTYKQTPKYQHCAELWIQYRGATQGGRHKCNTHTNTNQPVRHTHRQACDPSWRRTTEFHSQRSSLSPSSWYSTWPRQKIVNLCADCFRPLYLILIIMLQVPRTAPFKRQLL